jgi:hypothetical protein
MDKEELSRNLYRTKSEMPEEEVRCLNELSDDISAYKPNVIFIYTKSWVEEMDLYLYLSKVGFIESAMSNYQEIIKFKDYYVFVRKDLIPKLNQNNF